MFNRQLSLFILVIITILGFSEGCKNPFEPKYELIYSCSFESAADTIGWQGISPEMFVDDPAPNCGNQSLYIGGGCIMPTAMIILDATASSGKYRLTFWGKKGEEGGNVKLVVVHEQEYISEIEIHIDSEEWKFYQIEKNLVSQPNSQLLLEFWVGGIVFNSMFVDGIKVEQEI